MMKAKAILKGLNFNMRHLDEGIPMNVIGDSHRLQQIAITIVENAISYTSEGSVTMSVAFNKYDQ
jgi:signal transduction histidine kinase